MATKNSSMVKQAEIIPQVNQESLRLALAEVQEALTVIPEWKTKAEAWVVDSPEEFRAAGEWRRAVRSERKVPGMKLAPFAEIVKRADDFLKSSPGELSKSHAALDSQNDCTTCHEPDKSVTARPPETRMGKGKGQPEYWVATVRPGNILFELDGVTESVARESLRLAADKLPVRTKFLSRHHVAAA